MEKAAVYYFSGTGNSLYLAKALAEQLDGGLIPLVSAAGMERVCPDADVIGLVYPVFYNDLPVIVREFAAKLTGIKGKYIFAVCNYGGCGSQSIKTLEKIIEASGGELAAAYGIHMPQNAFKKPWENNLRTIERGGRKAVKIAGDVSARKKGNHLKGILNYAFLRLHPKLLPGIRDGLIKRTGLPTEASYEALVRANDRLFTAGVSCTGCGLCARVCPVGNIILDGGKPKWLGRCENCLACYDWCPSKAIEGGVAHKGYYYTNPRITAAELMAQKD